MKSNEIEVVLKEDTPIKEILLRRAVTLSLGVFGGVFFFFLSLPLPWLLGAMFMVTVAALSGVKVQMQRSWRLGMSSVLGVLLGAGFTSEILNQLPNWTLSLVVLAGSMTIITVLLAVYLRWSMDCNSATAWFAAAPGGINEMVTAGGGFGGDEKIITLIHGVRLFVLVFGIPFVFKIITDTEPPSLALGIGMIDEIKQLAFIDAVVLLACAVGGLIIGKLFHFPAFALTGPMLVSGLVHVFGWVSVHPPVLIIIVAQLVVGTALGASFSGYSWGSVRKIIGPAFGGNFGVLLACIFVSALLSPVMGVPFMVLMLAFIPGGATEMGLIALILGLDTAFIASHHLARVVLVISCAPLAFRTLRSLFR